ncbi:MAG: V-type ATP synthase subunit K [Spirochaetaceae bacterium]|jgi:V/A-type H+-transporting ATPase subunit K|nr:V-type ATP synthase subunit K [Spirochaetaceae bacterium]
MSLGLFGAACVFGISAVGSALGLGISGTATIGAWKRCYMNNKPAPFILTVFAGAPLTQTIYGFLLMQTMMGAVTADNGAKLLGIGIFSGLAIAVSAYVQGQAGASGSDALGETGKGFSQYIMVVGLCETVALFAMVFSMLAVNM